MTLLRLGRLGLRSFMPSRRLYSEATNLVGALRSKCECCGAPFHENGNTLQPGHRINKTDIKTAQSVKAAKNSTFDQIVNSLDSDQRKLLQQEAIKLGGSDVKPSDVIWDTNSKLTIAKSKANQGKELKQDDLEKMCKRCYDTTSTNEQPEIVQPIKTSRDLFDLIPQHATIVHVIDAMDFPASLDTSLRNAKQRVVYVVNKADLFMGVYHKCYERALPFVRNYLVENVKAKPENIFMTSSKAGWGITELYSLLGGENYLVGYANSGKTRLAVAMAQAHQGLPKEGTRQRRLGHGEFPWTTQGTFAYELKDDKVLVDLPSLPERDDGVWKYLAPKITRKIHENEPHFRNGGSYNVRRSVLSKPTHTFTLGGIVAIEKAEGHADKTLIVWPLAPMARYSGQILKSVDKVKELAGKPDFDLRNIHQTNRLFFNKPEYANELAFKQQFTIGGSGLVLTVRGIGSIACSIHGKIPPEGMKINVYTLPNVVVRSRPDMRFAMYEKTVKKGQKAAIPPPLRSQIKNQKMKKKQRLQAQAAAAA